MSKASEHTHLNFDDYTKVEQGYMLLPEPDDKYKALPEIYGRACSVIYFASKIGKKPDRACVHEKALTEAMLRAALSEFISIGDYIGETYPDHKKIWFNEHTDTDPIFHMLKLLRNYNIHIDSSAFSYRPISVKTMLPDNQESDVFEVNIHVISNLSVEGFGKVLGAKKYTSSLQTMIDIFDEQQHHFGVGTLIMKCVLDNMRKLDVLLMSEE